MINNKDLRLEVGQKVYWADLEGKVIQVDAHDMWLPYKIEFKGGIRYWFTPDGYREKNFKESQLPLSLTPYTVNLDGYTNTPPLPKLDKDKIVYVRDYDSSPWYMVYPSHFDKGGRIKTFMYQKKEGDVIPWEQYSFTNPLEEK